MGKRPNIPMVEQLGNLLLLIVGVMTRLEIQ